MLRVQNSHVIVHSLPLYLLPQLLVTIKAKDIKAAILYEMVIQIIVRLE